MEQSQKNLKASMLAKKRSRHGAQPSSRQNSGAPPSSKRKSGTQQSSRKKSAAPPSSEKNSGTSTSVDKVEEVDDFLPESDSIAVRQQHRRRSNKRSGTSTSVDAVEEIDEHQKIENTIAGQKKHWSRRTKKSSAKSANVDEIHFEVRKTGRKSEKSSTPEASSSKTKRNRGQGAKTLQIERLTKLVDKHEAQLAADATKSSDNSSDESTKTPASKSGGRGRRYRGKKETAGGSGARESTVGSSRTAASGDAEDVIGFVVEPEAEAEPEVPKVKKPFDLPDGWTFPVPIKGEVFLPSGWVELGKKDFGLLKSAMQKGVYIVRTDVRHQHYTTTFKDFEFAKQVNDKTGMAKNLRFTYEEGALPEKDGAGSDCTEGLMSDELQKAVRFVKEHKEEDEPVTIEDMMTLLDAKNTQSNETAVELCKEGGLARSNYEYIREDRPDLAMFLACHDDVGSGLDLCFYRKAEGAAEGQSVVGSTSICRQSYLHLLAYPINEDGSFEIKIKSGVVAGQETVLRGVLVDAEPENDRLWLETTLPNADEPLVKAYLKSGDLIQ